MSAKTAEVTPMVIGDVNRVVEIENSGHPGPWPRSVFVDELDREWARLDVVRIGDVDSNDAGLLLVVAFCNYWIVRDEIHLLNIATHPAHRRRGYGDMLMRHLLAVAREHGCTYVTLEVRRSNSAAIALYERFGFSGVGVRRNYYVEDREDAIVMALDIE